MCGISGIITFNNKPVEEASIRRMMQIQKHRGPDDEGVFIENNVGLGFVRLSILDLSPAGNQPMFTSDQNYVIVFNGEIFNYIELRDELMPFGYIFKTNTDTEVLLAAYQHWGEDCLNHFNGMWSFVIYDRERNSLFASRDRYGIKPFYYYVTDELFAFASEIKPLLSLLPGKPTADNQSIFDYLVFNRTDQTERTFFSEIKKLQHGHCIAISTKHQNIISSPLIIKKSIKKWYNLKERVQNTKGFKSPEEFRALFSSAVGLRLRSDVPVGVCLSGGLDSSSIVSVLIHDYKKDDLSTFSAVYTKGQFGDESEFIKEYSSSVSKMYYTSPNAQSLLDDLKDFVKTHNEPIPSTGPYAQYKVMQLARDKVVVTLDGQGADEELAGYHYFFGFLLKDLLLTGRIGQFSSETWHYLINHNSTYGLKSLLFFLLPQRVRTWARVVEKEYVRKDFITKYKNTNLISDTLYDSNSLRDALLDHFEYKLEHLLKWEDSNSMRFSLEARVPFLDYRLVESLLATQREFIIRKGATKYILRESMRGIVPEKIRLRKDKMGFGTPQDEWFRTKEWQRLISEILNSKAFLSRNIIDSEVAKRKYEKHLAEKKNYSKDIWKWVHLELWYRQYID